MARMYAKVKGASLNQAYTKSGDRFKSNKNINVEIDMKRLAKEVIKTIQNVEEEEPKENWKLSTVGATMLASQLATAMNTSNKALSTGDNAQMAMTNYTNTKGTGMLLLSTFGGPVGMIMSVLLNRIDGLVGQAIENQIQLRYDNARLDYNLTRMDIGRNSTYTYDYEQNKWVARDVQRIKNNILNQTTSV